MRQLTRVERAAMWFYHDEYAAQALGAINFYTSLPIDRKRLMERMVEEILTARP